MSKRIEEVLKHYWGYDSLRPNQNEIIESILSGRDTLAILPTGGGKSLCYQLPSLLLPGITIVISPLIALMHEQVSDLKNRGISAYLLHGGLKHEQIDAILDNCIYGETKFLYMAPERLNSRLVLTRLKLMAVNFIAIDEAHCISQWGQDFRPEYKEIGNIREHVNVPLMALTGSATKSTRSDILEKLNFRQPQVVQGSILRTNLSYQIRKEVNKQAFLERFLSKQQGSGIIYIRNRKKTEKLSSWLVSKGFSSAFYHAGMSGKDRKSTQEEWMRNETQIIVSTNAFGMGINKGDVRWVVHFDLPSNLEEFYQETGRAGRDGEPAITYLLWNDEDIKLLIKNWEDNFPDKKIIQTVYQSLANMHQIASGTGEGEKYPYDIYALAKRAKTSPKITFNALKTIERAGYWYITENDMISSKLIFKMSHRAILDYTYNHPLYGKIIQTLLRSYSGLHTDYQKIDEDEIAKRCEIPKRKLEVALQKMHEQDILDYQRVHFLPTLFFIRPRVGADELYIPKEIYTDRKRATKEQLKTFIDFIKDESYCRFIVMGRYFDEQLPNKCGKCDNCNRQYPLTLKEIKGILPIAYDDVKEIELKHPGTREKIKVMLNEGMLVLDDQEKVIRLNV